VASRKVALVPGGATGIGKSAVLALAAAGYDIVVNYNSSEAAARATAREAELGAKALLAKCDVSDEAAFAAMLDSINKTFGRLDVLINNAGTTAAWKTKDLDSLSARRMGRVFAVNVPVFFR